jgi:potassium-dependent mechanosensitive channel
MKGRRSVINIKNQFLYQRYTNKLEIETDQIQAKLNNLSRRLNHAKLHLNVALSDSVFRKLFADKKLRATFKDKLTRLERKYQRTDSITSSNIDSLNAMKVKLSDNSYNLSNMLNIMDNKMDRAVPKLFGPEVNCLWEKEIILPPVKLSSRSIPISFIESEKNAIGYYIRQTSGERNVIIVLGILLFSWLFLKRKLLKNLVEQRETYGYLHFKYINNHPVLSLIVLLLCLMPFFDAYAPTSYISIVYLFLLAASSVILIRKGDRNFIFNWLVLMVLFVADTLNYLLIEPTFAERILLLAVHSGILVFSIRFYQSLSKQRSFFRLLKWSTVIGIILSGLGILLNLFGRFSLSGIVGIASIFAVTQAVVLTIFVEVIVEIILLQLQSSRLKKDLTIPFDTDNVIRKIKAPMILIASIIWLIMLASNLNVYHSIRNEITDALTTQRTIGSISFQWLSVILFIGIIWSAHIMQRLVSFILGDTGTGSEDVTTLTKGQHSRMLITRLLVLIGGYLLAIAASGLPIDKLTFLLGALGVGIGMGLQHIVNNVVSGVILIFDGTLQVGDEIEVSGQSGKVKEIGLRASTLTTDDGADVIIPNGNILSSNIVNWTFTNNEKRVILTISLTGKELDANVINEIINGTIKKIPNVIAVKKPVILYTKVTSESCTLTIRFWSTTTNGDLVKSEAMLQLSAAFAAREIGFE